MTIEYSNRFCIFIDVLGFEEKIDISANDSDEGRNQLDAIDNLIKRLRALQDTIQRDPGGTPSMRQEVTVLDFQATQFSDSLVISFLDVSPEGPAIRHAPKHCILVRLHYLLRDMLFEGFLFRGGMTYGKLHHTPEKIFGPAFIKAYSLEKSAVYPRLMTDFDTVKRVNLTYPEQESDYLLKTFKEEASGLVYWDYLSLENVFSVERGMYGMRLIDFFVKLSEIIDKGLASSNERIKDKYDWLAMRFHTSVQKLAREEGRIPLSQPISGIEKSRWGNLLVKYQPKPSTNFRPGLLG